MSKWREVFPALPPRGEHTLVGAIATQLARDPDDVFESLVTGKRMGWDRVGGKVLFHFSDRSATAPAAAVRVWLGEDRPAGAPDETKCYVCTHVLDGALPVLYVTRPEGDWCALCGGDHQDEASAYRVVGLNHVIEGSDNRRGDGPRA